MSNKTIVVVSQDNKGLFRLMYKASALAFENNAALKLIMVQRDGTPQEKAKWLDDTFRCAQYFDAELCVYKDSAALEAALKNLNGREVRWAVAGGGFDFVKSVHRNLPGIPVMSKYDQKQKEEAAIPAM